MKAKGWTAYLVGGLLFGNGFSNAGLAVFGIGMLVDWKFWLLGILAFYVGFTWR